MVAGCKKVTETWKGAETAINKAPKTSGQVDGRAAALIGHLRIWPQPGSAVQLDDAQEIH